MLCIDCALNCHGLVGSVNLNDMDSGLQGGGRTQCDVGNGNLVHLFSKH